MPDRPAEVSLRWGDANSLAGLIGMAQRGAEEFGCTSKLSIDAELAQLLRLRVAQMNRCAYYLDVHTAAAQRLARPVQ